MCWPSISQRDTHKEVIYGTIPSFHRENISSRGGPATPGKTSWASSNFGWAGNSSPMKNKTPRQRESAPPLYPSSKTWTPPTKVPPTDSKLSETWTGSLYYSYSVQRNTTGEAATPTTTLTSSETSSSSSASSPSMRPRPPQARTLQACPHEHGKNVSTSYSPHRKMVSRVNPMVGLAAHTTARMDAVILVQRMVTHLSLWRTAVRGIVPVVPWRRRYVTRRCSAATRQP